MERYKNLVEGVLLCAASVFFLVMPIAYPFIAELVK